MPPRDLADERFLRTTRRAMLLALPLGALGIAAALVMDIAFNRGVPSPVDRIGFPLLALGLLGGAALVLFDARRAPLVGRGVFAMIALYVLSATLYQYGAFLPRAGRMSEVAFWAFPLYLGAFLVFPMHLAFLLGLGLWAVLAAGGVTGLLAYPAGANVVLQYQAAGAVTLALGYLLGLHRSWYAEAQREASFDALTGLPNRREMQRVLAHLYAQGEREGRGFAVILFDFDDFKRINDTLGHWVGDEVLVAAARALKTAVREGDWMGRWGGEEFLVVLPEATLEAARLQADRLSTRLKALTIHGVRLSASFGVASWQPGEPLPELLARVDRAMYAAKEKGKGRVEVA